MELNTDLDQIIKEVDEKGKVRGIWKPKIRRQLKDHGLLVVKNKTDYTVSKDYEPLVGKQQIFVNKKLPKSIVKFYLDKGIQIDQIPKYEYGCGYPSDSWDICECDKCSKGKNTKLGYNVYVKPITKS